ncbi:hypothetical protein DHW03_10480 [Pedobacter yonginense]|uniref:DUF4369 domain-containing protein n=1 Tax=Pedobacter yonginense TaxID=651869 RepID=A0A317EM76_9SPHI|nr:hypothetical protein [Pedobacter yonginense]PWS27980.1 hypothetical protein DHW03_10480 [Pedobacter yonginense]
MKYLLNLFLVSVSLLSATNCSAQFLSDFRGKPVNEQRYVQVTGSPFYAKNFLKGEVAFSNKNIKNVKGYLNYDQIQGIILFKPNFENQSATEIIDQVDKFTVTPDNGVPVNFISLGSIGLDGDSGFAEELLSGKVKLLKRVKKKIIETQVYNSANVEKAVVQETNYILVKDNKPMVLKQDRNSFLSALADKEDAIKKFLKDQKVNFKQDEDVVKLLNYYTSL